MTSNKMTTERGDERGIELESQPLNTGNVKIEIAPTAAAANSAKNGSTGSADMLPLGLTKEELLKYANDPFWCKLRKSLFTLFWLLWLAMLGGSFLIIHFVPSCPTSSKLRWFHKTSCSQLKPDLFESRLSSLLTNLDPLANSFGFSSLLFPPMFAKDAAGVTSYKQIDSQLGSLEQFGEIVKLLSTKHKTNALIDLDLTFTSQANDWFEKFREGEPKYANFFIRFNLGDSIAARGYSNDELRNSAGQVVKFVSFGGKPVLNLASEELLQELQDSLREWTRKGVKGVRLLNAPYLFGKPTPDGDTTPTEYTLDLDSNRRFLKSLAARLNLLVSDGALLLQLQPAFKEQASSFFSSGSEPAADLVVNPLLNDLGDRDFRAHHLKNELQRFLNSTPEWNVDSEPRGAWTGWLIASPTQQWRRQDDSCVRNVLGHLAPRGSPITFLSEQALSASSSAQFWQELTSNTTKAAASSKIEFFKQLASLRSEQIEAVMLGSTKFPLDHSNVFVMIRHTAKKAVLALVNLSESQQTVSLPADEHIGETGQVKVFCKSGRAVDQLVELRQPISLQPKETLVLTYEL